MKLTDQDSNKFLPSTPKPANATFPQEKRALMDEAALPRKRVRADDSIRAPRPEADRQRLPSVLGSSTSVSVTSDPSAVQPHSPDQL